MAYVIKDAWGRSPFWIACYTDSSGRRVRKSTKTKVRDVALRMALQLERAARLAGTGELTEVRARELISDLLEQTTDGRESVRIITTRQFLTTWLTGKKALLAGGSHWTYDAAIKGFLDYMGSRADRPLAAVQPPDLQGYVSRMHGRKMAAKTVGIYMKILRSAFKAARLQQLLNWNPAEAVELPRGESAERGTFTPAEVAILAAAAPSEDWRTVILVGAFTGQRLRDCTNLEWRNVDFVAGTVAFNVLKRGGKRLTLPLHPQLRERLEAIVSDTVEKYVSPSLANRSTGGKSGLSMEFKQIMAAAGVDAGSAESKGRRKMSARTFHSLRHGFVSGLANAGVGEDLRMKLAGHATRDVHSGYTHHELAVLSAAIAKLPPIK